MTPRKHMLQQLKDLTESITNMDDNMFETQTMTIENGYHDGCNRTTYIGSFYKNGQQHRFNILLGSPPSE